MSINVKLSAETVESARQQAGIFQRSLGGQIDYWAKLGRLAELHPTLTFDYLHKLMRENRLTELDTTQPHERRFDAVRIKTRNQRFDREEANARQDIP